MTEPMSKSECCGNPYACTDGEGCAVEIRGNRGHPPSCQPMPARTEPMSKSAKPISARQLVKRIKRGERFEPRPSPPVGEAEMEMTAPKGAGDFLLARAELEIERQRALIEQMQSALRPFAELEIDATRIKLIEDKHIHRARALIAPDSSMEPNRQTMLSEEDQT